jgi:hypothetical protein
MELFIDRLPMTELSIRLPVVISEPGLLRPPPNSQVADWFLDTGFTGEAFGWRSHLEAGQIDPEVNRYPRTARLRSSAFEGVKQLPIRRADLWLTSNLEAYKDRFVCLPLDEGVVFRDQQISTNQTKAARPLLGMRLLRRARLRLDIDFDKETVSVWVPTL